MPFASIADPQQLRLLTSVLDEFCLAYDLHDEVERQNAARTIMVLFTRGSYDRVELMTALEKSFLSDGGF